MNKNSIKDITFVGLFAALLCVFSPVSIPIGSIPVTPAVFLIFVCGGMLPPVQALSAVVIYLTLGGLGLPVFSNFGGGVDKLFGPTAGFLWAYPVMALIISLTVKRSRTTLALAVSMGASLLVMYTLACGWYMVFADVGLYAAIMVCVLPFVVFDVIKLIAGAVAIKGLKKIRIFDK